MNFLDEWYDALQKFRWENALVNDQHFRNITAIKQQLKDFFPEKNLSNTLMQGHDNWVLHILADKQPNSIYLINEVSELLRYYNTLDDRQAYNIIAKDGQINYRGLPEKLFELHVNYLLRSVGLEPKIGMHYLIENKKKKSTFTWSIARLAII